METEHYNSAKTECKRGHLFTTSNTYVRPNGKRTCRKCEASRLREKRYEYRRNERMKKEQ